MSTVLSNTHRIRTKPLPRREPPQFLFSWATFITFGTLLTGMGIFTVVFSTLSFGGLRTVLTLVIGCSGVLYLLLGLRSLDWEGKGGTYLSGLLYLAASIYTAQCVTSPEELAFILGPTLLVEGILLSVVSLLLKLSSTWRWLLVSGFASIAIAFLLVGGAGTNYNIITNLFALNLITTGVAYNAYGFDLQNCLKLHS